MGLCFTEDLCHSRWQGSYCSDQILFQVQSLCFVLFRVIAEKKASHKLTQIGQMSLYDWLHWSTLPILTGEENIHPSAHALFHSSAFFRKSPNLSCRFKMLVSLPCRHRFSSLTLLNLQDSTLLEASLCPQTRWHEEIHALTERCALQIVIPTGCWEFFETEPVHFHV